MGRAAAAFAFLAGSTPLLAQDPPQSAPVDTMGLGTGPWATMSMLYERTFLNVDVLRLTLRFGAESADAIELAAPEGESSLVAAAVDSRNAAVRVEFLRDVTLAQFLDGLERNLGRALDAGVIDQDAHDAIMADVSVQYDPIEERGFRNGDTMWYRIRGDALDIVLRTSEGEEPVREQATGPERRRATLAGFLAPGSSFREGLLKSLRLAES
jgi:hypothetical protein